MLVDAGTCSTTHAASGRFEVIVDVERTRFVPALIGSVGAVRGDRLRRRGVSFSGSDRRGRGVERSLQRLDRVAPASFQDPDLDFDRSYISTATCGAIDRFGSLLGDDPGVEPQRSLPCRGEAHECRARRIGVLARAEQNTWVMLQAAPRPRLHAGGDPLLGGLGARGTTARRSPHRAPRDHDRVVERRCRAGPLAAPSTARPVRPAARRRAARSGRRRPPQG